MEEMSFYVQIGLIITVNQWCISVGGLVVMLEGLG